MYCKPSTALRCKRLWPNRAADAPTVRTSDRSLTCPENWRNSVPHGMRRVQFPGVLEANRTVCPLG